MSPKFWEELSSDYEKLFEEEIGYDVIIYAGEEPNVKEIHAHSNILSIRSQYFRTAFSNEWFEKKKEIYFRKPPHLFNIILKYGFIIKFSFKKKKNRSILMNSFDDVNL